MEKNSAQRVAAPSRRSFLMGTGVVAAGVAAVGLTACSSDEEEDEESTTVTGDWMPEAWDAEVDILIVGTGAAGLSAAITAATEDLGSVLILEAAPEGEGGGNTRVSGQLLFIPDTAEDAITYQTALNADYVVEDELMQAWAENLVENYDWLTDLGADLQEASSCNPEFPDIDGSDGCHTYLHEGVTGKSRLWEFLMEVADDYDCEIQYDSRVVKLVFDPYTKEVYGVQTEDGAYYKANKGVILACGGFENNPEMIRNYYTSGYYELMPGGTPYNRGDAITMCQAIGADFWHMNNYSLSYLAAAVSEDCPSGSYPSWSSKDYIYVGPNSKRYIYEETSSLSKHGKTLTDGVYVSSHVPLPQHVIFGSQAFEAGNIFPDYPYNWPDLVCGKMASDNQGYVDAGLIVTADTVAELAELIGLDPDTLEETVNTYNEYCETGVDLDFGRGEDVYGNFGGMLDGGTSTGEESVVVSGFDLVPLEAPFYAFEEGMTILNTQGGPKRGADGGVLDTEGNAIPRLYTAGELGCVYSYMYNGGGNVSEAVSSGRLAARSCGALGSWDASEE